MVGAPRTFRVPKEDPHDEATGGHHCGEPPRCRRLRTVCKPLPRLAGALRSKTAAVMSLSAPDDLALGLLRDRGMLVADGPLFALPCPRLELPGARDDRLYFAQVREDPALEIEALRVGPTETAVVVSSGGCTALSLLASSAGKVVSVDLNRSQNHLVELKVAAVRGLDREASVGFLGGAP